MLQNYSTATSIMPRNRLSLLLRFSILPPSSLALLHSNLYFNCQPNLATNVVFQRANQNNCINNMSLAANSNSNSNSAQTNAGAGAQQADEFGDYSWMDKVDVDAISASVPPSQEKRGDENSSSSNKRRKVSPTPDMNDSHNNNNNSNDGSNDNSVKHSQTDLEETLLQYFGYPSFRTGQLEAIQAILNDKKDVAVFQSTGSGKSIMYQIPGLHQDNNNNNNNNNKRMVLVVSPLISLMQDQVHKLNGLTDKNTADVATFLGSGQTDGSKEWGALNGEYALVYVTPEKLLSGGFLERLEALHADPTKRDIAMIAIDEAHCVSEWGHDFRTDYRHVGSVLRSRASPVLQQIPIMALTATAVPRVQQDIIQSLQLNNPKIIRQSFDRTNLILSVHKKDRNMALASAMEPLLKSLHQTPGESTIVYASTRNQVEEIASFLQQRLEQQQQQDNNNNDSKVKVEGYHAGLSLQARNEAHTNFLTGKTTVIVATVAFGLGIDKPDTRRVIHYGPPKTVEEYYQQIGRAGRDGRKAECTMYVSEGDFDRYKSDFYLGKLGGAAKEAVLQSIASLKSYSLDSTKCRRKTLLEFFSETPSFGNRCGTCDNCRKHETLDANDLERDFGPSGARVVLQAVDGLNEAGLTTILSVIAGKQVESYRYKRGVSGSQVKEDILQRKEELNRKMTQDAFRELIVPLTQQGYLQESSKSSQVNGYSRTWTTYTLTSKGRTALSDRSIPVMLPVPDSVREAERLERARRERVMAQLQQSGVKIEKLPQEEVEAGDGEVIRAWSKWTSYLESMRKNGKEDRALQLESLLQAVEAWRAETAIKYRMSPATVLAEHTLLKLSYAAATLPSGMTLTEPDLVAAGVRTREVGGLVKLLSRESGKLQSAASMTNDGSTGDSNKASSKSMSLEPGRVVHGKVWEYSVYKPLKKTGLASWESSYNRFAAGESPQTIAITPVNGRPIQVRTVCGHIVQALLHGKGVDLHRLAQFLPPPSADEWFQMEAAEHSSGVDVCGNPISCGLGGGKLAKGDLLKPILGDALIDLPYNERSDEDKALLGSWYDKLEWYMTLRRIEYNPTFS